MFFVVEIDKYIFVYVGIDLILDDWYEIIDYKKVWFRKLFYEVENYIGKSIVFGYILVYGLLK